MDPNSMQEYTEDGNIMGLNLVGLYAGLNVT